MWKMYCSSTVLQGLGDLYESTCVHTMLGFIPRAKCDGPDPEKMRLTPSCFPVESQNEVPNQNMLP